VGWEKHGAFILAISSAGQGKTRPAGVPAGGAGGDGDSGGSRMRRGRRFSAYIPLQFGADSSHAPELARHFPTCVPPWNREPAHLSAHLDRRAWDLCAGDAAAVADGRVIALAPFMADWKKGPLREDLQRWAPHLFDAAGPPKLLGEA